MAHRKPGIRHDCQVSAIGIVGVNAIVLASKYRISLEHHGNAAFGITRF